MKSARRLIEGDDGLPAEEVGIWAVEKHKFLKRYLDISRATRQKFLGDGNAGATYIDLFCGTGRARIRETGAWTRRWREMDSNPRSPVYRELAAPARAIRPTTPSSSPERRSFAS